MTDNTYNGWTNWETWQINLWLDNEEPWYRSKKRFLMCGKLDIDSVKKFCSECFGKEATPDMNPGDWDKVNWEEILQSFKDEATEYE